MNPITILRRKNAERNQRIQQIRLDAQNELRRQYVNAILSNASKAGMK